MAVRAGTRISQPSSNWVVHCHGAMVHLDGKDWDICAGGRDALVTHRHLMALETSGVVSPEQGFEPCHLVLRDGSGLMLAAAPTYLKRHSRGELGVDLGLSLGHARLAGPYYPKLQVEVPLMPFAGPRFLVRPGVDRPAAVRALIAGLQGLAEERGASSVQIGYMEDAEDLPLLAAAGHAIAETGSYVWQAGPDRSFEQMLERMTSASRSEIRRQRRRVRSQGLAFRHFRGEGLTPDMVAPFFALYRENFDRHRTEIWLTEAYFRQVFRTMSQDIDLSVSFDGPDWVGAVFGMQSRTHGQVLYWGQGGHIPFLHFEQVIYRGIERALVTGLASLDFGPTGAHKADRGLRSEPAHHALWFRNPAFRDIAAAACRQKSALTQAARTGESARSPFLRKG